METVTYASISVQRGWSHVQKASSATPPRPSSSEYICLSQTAIYRTGRPCLRFPLLAAVMRSCNSLSVSPARSRSISPSLPVSLCLSLSLSRHSTKEPSSGNLHTKQLTQSSGCIIKIRETGDRRKKGDVKANVKDSLGNSGTLLSRRPQLSPWKSWRQ